MLASIEKRPWWLMPVIGVGLLMIGGAISHQLWPPNIVQVQELPRVPQATSGAEAVVDSFVTMPDVAGLRLETARRAVADAGMPGEVTTKEQPAAGPTGLVVDQSPAPGASSGPVVLTVSTQANLPDLTGKPLTNARRALEGLGATVRTTRTVSASTPGTVISSNPAPGQPLPATVELSIADAGLVLPLDQLIQAENRGCSYSGRATIGGLLQQATIECSLDAKEPRYIDYILSRHAQAFDATVGLDDSRSQGAASFKIIGDDGAVLQGGTVTYGHPLAVHLVVVNTLRLRLQVEPSPALKGVAPSVVFGEPAVSGDPTELSQAKR
jgi:hypothetical protein